MTNEQSNTHESVLVCLLLLFGLMVHMDYPHSMHPMRCDVSNLSASLRRLPAGQWFTDSNTMHCQHCKACYQLSLIAVQTTAITINGVSKKQRGGSVMFPACARVTQTVKRSSSYNAQCTCTINIVQKRDNALKCLKIHIFQPTLFSAVLSAHSCRL